MVYYDYFLFPFFFYFFFFQAEDGIRDLTVTGFRRVLFRSEAKRQEARRTAPGAHSAALHAACRGLGARGIRRYAGALHGERGGARAGVPQGERPRLRSEEHTSELQSQSNLVCRLLLEKKKN